MPQVSSAVPSRRPTPAMPANRGMPGTVTTAAGPSACKATSANGCQRPMPLHDSYHRAWMTPTAWRYWSSTGSTPNAESGRV